MSDSVGQPPLRTPMFNGTALNAYWARWFGSLYTALANYGIRNSNYAVAEVSSGFSYTFAPNTRLVVLSAAAPLASGTITLPARPVAGQLAGVAAAQAVAALTIIASAPVAAAPASLAVGQSVNFMYVEEIGLWLPTPS